MTTNEYDLVARATELAAQAHAGQEDKQGQPYILHPLRVGIALHAQGFAPWVIAGGILHDTIEDGGPNVVTVLQTTFPDYVVNLVATVSRRQDEAYDAFIKRVSTSSFGTIVKLADLRDNLGRWNPDMDPSGSLKARYIKAIDFLDKTWKI